MKITVAQLDPTVGALDTNVERLAQLAAEAAEHDVDLVVAPELASTGYPPRDLLDRPAFVRDALAALRRLSRQIGRVPLLLGAVVSHRDDPVTDSGRISNGAVLLAEGRITACHRKILLPVYDVFDEERYFVPGTQPTVVDIARRRVGLTVCEDIWNDKDYWRNPRYERDPVQETLDAGCDLLINVSASPYDRHKPAERSRMLATLARHHHVPLLYVNQVGGNDSLIFDGRSVALSAGGTTGAQLPAFAESVTSVTIDGTTAAGPVGPATDDWRGDVVDALCLGLRDYVRKCGFERVVLGLSGGIDSALTAALAVRALGADRVLGVTMPSRFSSEGATSDALELGRRLGIQVDAVPIEPMFAAFLEALRQPFAGKPWDVTEENIQARIRGTLLMAYSNKLGALLLSTGNKSELAVGYCTLYGDMSGGLAVISDLYKTEVYGISRYLNEVDGEPIPPATLAKPPSAELRADQTDQDSLPSYDNLDAVLRSYIDHADSVDHLIAAGHDPALVNRIVRMVERAEYKRRQMAPGLRVSRKAFGEGRRLPIAQSYSS